MENTENEYIEEYTFTIDGTDWKALVPESIA
jgi:hypothetical protein